METVTLNGSALDAEALERIAGGAHVELDAEALERVARNRAGLERAIGRGDTIYGVCFNPAVGGLCSTWNGQPWKPVAHFPKDTAGILFDVAAEGQHLWVATQKGIYHSPDAGQTWQFSRPLTNLPNPGDPVLRLHLTVLNGTIVVTNEVGKRLYFSRIWDRAGRKRPGWASGYTTPVNIYWLPWPGERS